MFCDYNYKYDNNCFIKINFETNLDLKFIISETYTFLESYKIDNKQQYINKNELIYNIRSFKENKYFSLDLCIKGNKNYIEITLYNFYYGWYNYIQNFLYKLINLYINKMVINRNFLINYNLHNNDKNVKYDNLLIYTKLFTFLKNKINLNKIFNKDFFYSLVTNLKESCFEEKTLIFNLINLMFEINKKKTMLLIKNYTLYFKKQIKMNIEINRFNRTTFINLNRLKNNLK